MSETPLTDALAGVMREWITPDGPRVVMIEDAIKLTLFARSLELQVTSLTAKLAGERREHESWQKLALWLMSLPEFHDSPRVGDTPNRVRLCVESLRSQLVEARRDSERVDHLEKLIKACPHARFYWTEDTDEEMPVGFSITIEGCETSQVVGATFRECVDAEIAIDALPPAPTK